LFGYVLWGLSTILFPTTAYIHSTSVAVVLVVLMDSLMTFFGSTANDAAFNAWTADVATTPTRGRVEGVLNLSVFLAQIVAMVAAGALIDQYGYFLFFYSLGAIVIVVGVIAGSLLRDVPLSEGEIVSRPPFWKEFTELFRVDLLKQNRVLFILLLFIMVSSIGMQVAMPYLIIYLENYVGMTKTQFSVVGGAALLGSALVAIPFGFLADRWNKSAMIFLATVVSSLGGFALSLVNSLAMLALTGFFWQAFALAGSVASVAWLKDLLPEQNRGKFLGIRMIFWIAIPMVVGPWIGSQLIQAYGIPTTMNGEAGFIPTPILFQVGAAITLLSLIPLWFIRKNGDSRKDGVEHA
jgi:MFS family permease